MRITAIATATLLTLILIFNAAQSADPPTTSTNSPIDYLTQIRPLLSDTCFNCHGPDPASRKADLRLDTLEGQHADLGGYQAILPNNPDESELIARITSTNPDEIMPPPDSGKSLTPDQTQLITRWVQQGAPFQKHWAFVTPTKPATPQTSNPDWEANPIDAFIAARLESESLQPSPQADRTTLIRRLYLDLIGLPPSIQQVDAFLADPSPNAYEKLADQLLASKHHGEKWARWWLDAARYADSDGFEKDKQRSVWFYRDYVINSLNNDKPYDQFIIEQIAGDLLPNPTQDQLVATGYLRNSMINEEGGIDPEQFRMEAMFDRMDAIGKSVLGLTIQCAQCHTHKFDPLTQREYYQMFALINNAHEASVSVYTPQQQMQRAQILESINTIENSLRHTNPDWPQRMAEWEQSVRGNQPEWTIVQPEPEAISTGGQKYIPQPDGSFLAQGYAPTKHNPRFDLNLPPNSPPITGFRIELLTDPNLPHNGPGRSIFGTATLSEINAAFQSQTPDTELKWIGFNPEASTADINPPRKELDPTYDDKSDKKRYTGPAQYAVDGDDLTAWSNDTDPARRNANFKLVAQPSGPIDVSSGGTLQLFLKQRHGGYNSDDNQTYNLGRFRIAITSAPNPTADPLPATVRNIIENIPASQRTQQQTNTVFSHFRTTIPDWNEANTQIESLYAQHPQPTSQLTLLARNQPRQTHMLNRGDFLQPTNEVTGGTPSFLHQLKPSDEPGRLRFAKWLVDPQSPTTARSIVNRVWQSYFGTGLVETSEDLGSQAPKPSHPKLLDYLAVEFMQSGWSLKHLHKLIVTSNTYRQSSTVSDHLLEKDPYNRLLARGPRFRVNAEAVRDIALASSGLLDTTIGGPSAFPPIPDFMIQPPISNGPKPWGDGPQGDSSTLRRALYIFRYRALPYPVLSTFDAPTGEAACVRRDRSNTPMQALVTLNEQIFMQAARALANRAAINVYLSNPDPTPVDSRILTLAFRYCVSRPPNPDELTVLQSLVDQQRKHFTNDPAAASALLDENIQLPTGLTPADLAAYTIAARVILNLDETITKP